jgi:hypothetical protein
MTDPTLDRIEHRLARVERQNRILIGLLCAMAVVASITATHAAPNVVVAAEVRASASRCSIRVAASPTIGTRMTRVVRIRRIPRRVIQDGATTLPELTIFPVSRDLRHNTAVVMSLRFQASSSCLVAEGRGGLMGRSW